MDQKTKDFLVETLLIISISLIFVGSIFILAESLGVDYDEECIMKIVKDFCLEEGYESFPEYKYLNSNYFQCYNITGNERTGIKKDYDTFYFLEGEIKSCLIKPTNCLGC